MVGIIPTGHNNIAETRVTRHYIVPWRARFYPVVLSAPRFAPPHQLYSYRIGGFFFNVFRNHLAWDIFPQFVTYTLNSTPFASRQNLLLPCIHTNYGKRTIQFSAILLMVTQDNKSSNSLHVLKSKLNNFLFGPTVWLNCNCTIMYFCWCGVYMLVFELIGVVFVFLVFLLLSVIFFIFYFRLIRWVFIFCHCILGLLDVYSYF